jgi:hypothetical protein
VSLTTRILPFNPGPPYTIAPVITSDTFDLSAVLSAEIHCVGSDWADRSFTATVGTATLSGSTWTLTVTYELALGDLDLAGPYKAEVWLSTATGLIKTDLFNFSVRAALTS